MVERLKYSRKVAHSRSKITKRLRDWVSSTHALNRKLRSRGIEPRYICGIRSGKFYEIRAQS